MIVEWGFWYTVVMVARFWVVLVVPLVAMCSVNANPYISGVQVSRGLLSTLEELEVQDPELGRVVVVRRVNFFGQEGWEFYTDAQSKVERGTLDAAKPRLMKLHQSYVARHVAERNEHKRQREADRAWRQNRRGMRQF